MSLARASTIWSDEDILEVMAMKDHDGKSASEIGRHFGVSKNSIIGLTNRIRKAADEHSAVGDGTLRPRWWERMTGIIREERIGDCRLILGDCLEVMPEIGNVDLLLTDPPFGVGNFVQTTGRLRGRGDGWGKHVEWNSAPPPPEFFEMARKISKHRIIWGANFFNCFEDRGGAIIWDKAQSMPNFSKADIASCTHFQKTEIVRIPWTNFTVAHKAETDHPCERPVSLYEWCINYLPGPVETVFDPFMGSASCMVACANLGRKGIGIELDPDYFEIACRRVEEAYRQPDLFVAPPTPPTQEAFDV